MRSGRYARPRMEAAISCKFHCKRLEARWRGYWPGVEAAELVADVEGRLASAAATWGLKDIEPLDGGRVALTCGATQNGRPVVLKLNPRDHPDDAQLAGEGHALAFWNATGAAAELLDQRGGNALRAGSGWKVIDPKGIRADRHADVWALVDPLTLEDFPHGREAEAAAHRRLQRYAEAAEMDLAKAREWTRIRAGAEAEEVDHPDWASALRRMANALG